MTSPIPDALERAPLAYENPNFLQSHDGRLIRIISEYAEPMARFQQQRIQDTVVFFGSARFRKEEQARKALDGLEGDALKRGKTAVEMARFYEDARLLSSKLTRWTMSLPSRCHRFVVTSGGGP